MAPAPQSIKPGAPPRHPDPSVLLVAAALACALMILPRSLQAAEQTLPEQWIGYTELRTNLPGGRHANVRTMRAVVVNAKGTGRRVLAEGLAGEPDSWTQFAGWCPDGRVAVL